jgi:dTDP-4-amino-4,6-dideoxygalactose transaminase
VGRFGVLGCFSFNRNKILACGGGVIVTDDDRLAERARYLTTQAKDDPVEYVHGEIGFNYRLTNLQAALGCA